MADKTSFIMDVKTTEDKNSKRSITDISPSATDAQIVALAQGFNNLTTNTLEGVSKVTTKDLSVTPKTARTIGIGSDQVAKTYTLNEFDSYYANFIECKLGDAQTTTSQFPGKPYIVSNDTKWPVQIINAPNSAQDTTTYWFFIIAIPQPQDEGSDSEIIGKKTGTIVFAIDADDTYESATFTLTLTEG